MDPDAPAPREAPDTRGGHGGCDGGRADHEAAPVRAWGSRRGVAAPRDVLKDDPHLGVRDR